MRYVVFIMFLLAPAIARANEACLRYVGYLGDLVERGKLPADLVVEVAESHHPVNPVERDKGDLKESEALAARKGFASLLSEIGADWHLVQGGLRELARAHSAREAKRDHAREETSGVLLPVIRPEGAGPFFVDVRTALGADGSVFVLGDYKNSVAQLVRFKDGKAIRIHGDLRVGSQFVRDPEGHLFLVKFIASGYRDLRMELVDLETDQVVGKIEGPYQFLSRNQFAPAVAILTKDRAGKRALDLFWRYGGTFQEQHHLDLETGETTRHPILGSGFVEYSRTRDGQGVRGVGFVEEGGTWKLIVYEPRTMQRFLEKPLEPDHGSASARAWLAEDGAGELVAIGLTRRGLVRFSHAEPDGALLEKSAGQVNGLFGFHEDPTGAPVFALDVQDFQAKTRGIHLYTPGTAAPRIYTVPEGGGYNPLTLRGQDGGAVVVRQEVEATRLIDLRDGGRAELPPIPQNLVGIEGTSDGKLFGVSYDANGVIHLIQLTTRPPKFKP